MSSKIKSLIISLAILAILISLYFFFIKGEKQEENLVSAPAAVPKTPVVSGEFLSLLLNVKNIKLDDSVFSNPAFSSLSDSSILLEPDGTEGRPNPFAPFNAPAPAPTPVPKTN